MNTTLIAAAFISMCTFVLNPGRDGIEDGVDSPFAHPVYNTFMPVRDVGYNEYRTQVVYRLTALESLLKNRDVSDWPVPLQKARAENIRRLREYRIAGAFPANYDHPDRQLPCFLDRNGNLCAVANLIATSEGMELVKRINRRYQYATVSQMNMPELDAWVARSGLTPEEVITIQEPGWAGESFDPRKEIILNQLAALQLGTLSDTTMARTEAEGRREGMTSEGTAVDSNDVSPEVGGFAID